MLLDLRVDGCLSNSQTPSQELQWETEQSTLRFYFRASYENIVHASKLCLLQC